MNTLTARLLLISSLVLVGCGPERHHEQAADAPREGDATATGGCADALAEPLDTARASMLTERAKAEISRVFRARQATLAWRDGTQTLLSLSIAEIRAEHVVSEPWAQPDVEPSQLDLDCSDLVRVHALGSLRTADGRIASDAVALTFDSADGQTFSGSVRMIPASTYVRQSDEAGALVDVGLELELDGDLFQGSLWELVAGRERAQHFAASWPAPTP